MSSEFSDSVRDAIRKALREKADRMDELEAKMSDPDLAGGGQYGEIAREHGELIAYADLYRRLEEAREKMEEAREFITEFGDDPDMERLASQEVDAAVELESRLYGEAARLLCSDHENRNRDVVMEIRSGAGGQEASLFAADLLRMYTYYAQRHGWTVRVMDRSLTDLGGVKNITVSIKGRGAWERLRFESGGHRVQRVPETESQGRIHTSLATVAVLPEAKQVDIEINPDELEFECMRSQGPGGQNVNKVNSCVRVTHKPTGIAVKCQEDKSQHKNRKLALELLRTKLYEKKLEAQKQERDALRRGQIGSGDRNERIRTYNFPQDRVTDHRIGMDLFGVEKVLMGDIDGIIDRLLEYDRESMLEQMAEAAV